MEINLEFGRIPIMASLTLRLVYDGLGATQHKMPTSLEKQITAGAQEFLGAHAYFFTEGRIPANVADHSRLFNVHDLRQRDGSWEALYNIDIANVATEFLTEYIRELTKNLAVEAALATKLGFMLLLHRSYKAWSQRTPMRDRTFDRIEPVFTEHSGNGAPFIDTERESDAQRRRLYERTHSSLTKISAPLGRAATQIDIWIDDQKLDRLERRIVTEEEITDALIPLREHILRQRLPGGRQPPLT